MCYNEVADIPKPISKKGGNDMKKFFALFLAVVMLVSSLAITISAQTGFYIGSKSFTYNGNRYCTCTLSNPGRKDAKVKVTFSRSNGCALTIKMTDNSGRYIWGEDYTVSTNAFGYGSRTYKLGKNHSVYRLYFRSTTGRGSGYVSVTNPSNCRIS